MALQCAVAVASDICGFVLLKGNSIGVLATGAFAALVRARLATYSPALKVRGCLSWCWPHPRFLWLPNPSAYFCCCVKSASASSCGPLRELKIWNAGDSSTSHTVNCWLSCSSAFIFEHSTAQQCGQKFASCVRSQDVSKGSEHCSQQRAAGTLRTASSTTCHCVLFFRDDVQE